MVDSTGGRLNVVFSTTNTGAGSDGFGNLQLKDASDNIVNYRIYLSESNGTNIAAGNIKAHLDLNTAMPETLPARTYTDTITVTVSPI